MECLNEIDANEIIDRDNLATLQIIKNFQPIEGKDRIVLATFENCGFKAVVQKDIHKVGDLVLVVKYDTILPELPMFEFMRDSKFRVKTKAFNSDTGKLFSQCIVIPLDLVIEELGENEIPYDEGDDLTNSLDVKKYIPPVKGTGSSFGKMRAKGSFPTQYISKTDETNCQSKPKVLDEFKGLAYSLTIKLDGSSMSCLIDPETNEFEVCSRNNSIKYDETNSFWKMAKKYDIENILRNTIANGYNYAIQGELIGEKIQGNKMGIKDLDFYVFNIINLDTRKRISFEEQMIFCLENGFNHVPVIEVGDSFNFTLDYLLDFTSKFTYDMCNGFSSKSPIEGLVLRPLEDIFSYVLKDRLSTKIMNPLFK